MHRQLTPNPRRCSPGELKKLPTDDGLLAPERRDARMGEEDDDGQREEPEEVGGGKVEGFDDCGEVGGGLVVPLT